MKSSLATNTLKMPTLTLLQNYSAISQLGERQYTDPPPIHLHAFHDVRSVCSPLKTLSSPAQGPSGGAFTATPTSLLCPPQTPGNGQSSPYPQSAI